jgi:carbon storage regulator CsrA
VLVLTRNVGETIVVAGAIRVTVVAVEGHRVRLGVEAPADVPVDRQEVHELRKSQRDALLPYPCGT